MQGTSRRRRKTADIARTFRFWVLAIRRSGAHKRLVAFSRESQRLEDPFNDIGRRGRRIAFRDVRDALGPRRLALRQGELRVV